MPNSELPDMPPFECFQIDKTDMCVSVALRHDFAIFVASVLSAASHGNPALNAIVSQLRACVDIMFGSRDPKHCSHLQDIDVIGVLPPGAAESRKYQPPPRHHT